MNRGPRSEKAREFRKQKRIVYLGIRLAETNGDKKIHRKLKIKKKKIRELSTVLEDVYGGTLFFYQKNFLESKDVEKLERDFEQFIEPKLHLFRDRRAQQRFGAAFGYWTARGHPDSVYMTPDFKKDVEDEVHEYFLWIAQKISTLIRNQYPKVAKLMSNIPSEFRCWDLFALMMPFLDGSQEYHKDHNDAHGGFCAVVALGDFEGGQIHLYDPDHNLNVEVFLQRGELLLFRSQTLQHKNLKVEGNRKVLVFVTHNTLLNYQMLNNS